MQENCFEKLFLCKFRLMFWHSSLLKFCPKKKNYSMIRKRYKQYKFFSTFSSKFCFGHVMCNFGSTDEKISPNVQLFRSMTESALTNIFASRKKNLKVFLWAHSWQFWSSCLTFLLKVQVFSAQSPELINKKQFFNADYPQICSSLHVGCCFETPD